jgi:hypothetical protein
MAGEIIKGTVNVNNLGYNGQSLSDLPIDTKIPNTVIALNSSDNNYYNINSVNDGDENVSLHDNKLLVDQGKAFVTKQVTFDTNVSNPNVDNVILDRINEWVAAYGNRYDDIIITVNPSGANHDIMVAIFRYF